MLYGLSELGLTVFKRAGREASSADRGSLSLLWIVVLGRFFTGNVAIAPDHRLIEEGPYRFVRHPSYTGSLLAFLGLGICYCNWASLAALMFPTLAVFLRRMQVEEAALVAAFGDRYRDYIRRTKRLIPAIY
jgi:protein-S-isoprenylcysteine O-methyltransferase